METPISPKVIVSAIVGIVLTSVVSNISALTPDMFDFLGTWKLFWFGTFITTLIVLAAWWKTDPLRILPSDAAKAAEDAAAAAAAALAAKHVSLAATAANAPATGTGWQGDGHGVAQDSPAGTFPKAAVDAAEAAQVPALADVEPAPVALVYTPPVA